MAEATARTDRDRRYTAGYVKGMKSKSSYHPYMAFDIIWAQGYRDAQKTRKNWTGR